MVIATIELSGSWADRTITREGGVFSVEDVGPVSAEEVMDHERPGHFFWAGNVARRWVSEAQARWFRRPCSLGGIW